MGESYLPAGTALMMSKWQARGKGGWRGHKNFIKKHPSYLKIILCFFTVHSIYMVL